MGKQVRESGEAVREFIVRNVADHPSDIVGLTARKFGCSRQAVHQHMRRLVDQGAIVHAGSRRVPTYSLAQLEARNWIYPIEPGLAEGDIWERDILPELQALPRNVLGIWNHVVTEMANNAIDHSGGAELVIRLERTAAATTLFVIDDGVGIFRKIQQDLDLVDERQSLFELSKGKLTTDPSRHSGQGIFFSSRMVNEFSIVAGDLIFDHERGRADWAERALPKSGTAVRMVMSNHTTRSTKKVFDEFSSTDGDYTFNKTIVPMTLARFGPAELISRSQAKRLMARVDLFEVVIFDFKGVDEIGQAFADEIFRVYAHAHPHIEMPIIHASKQVKEMIARARSEVAPTSNPD